MKACREEVWKIQDEARKLGKNTAMQRQILKKSTASVTRCRNGRFVHRPGQWGCCHRTLKQRTRYTDTHSNQPDQHTNTRWTPESVRKWTPAKACLNRTRRGACTMSPGAGSHKSRWGWQVWYWVQLPSTDDTAQSNCLLWGNLEETFPKWSIITFSPVTELAHAFVHMMFVKHKKIIGVVVSHAWKQIKTSKKPNLLRIVRITAPNNMTKVWRVSV